MPLFKKPIVRKNLSLWIAFRYFIAKKSKNIIHIISWISIITVTTCTAALIIILSVFNGFQDLVQNTYQNFYTDLKISPKKGKTMLFTDSMEKTLLKNPHIKTFSKVVQAKVLIQSETGQITAILKGVDSGYSHLIPIKDLLIQGMYFTKVKGAEIVLGYGLANALGVDINNGLMPPLTVYFANLETRSYNVQQEMRMGNFLPIGVFYSQQKEFDNILAFMDRKLLLPYLGLDDNTVSSLEMRLYNPNEIEKCKAELQDLFPNSDFLLQTLYEQNEQLFAVLTGEKKAIFIILTFVLLIASFNISSTLVLSVLEKKKHIVLFKIMGLHTAKIQRIFLFNGLILGLAGCLLGVIIGTIIVFLQSRFHLIPIQGDNFMIDYFPVKMVLTDYISVLLITLTISFLATLNATYKAGKVARTITLNNLP